jgi:hypothetical protein
MKTKLLMSAATLLAVFLLQLDGPANAGSFVAGRSERSPTLTSTPKSSSVYRPTSHGSAQGSVRGSAYGSPSRTAYGSSSSAQQPNGGWLGPTHGRRLTPAETRMLMNNPSVGRCGVNVRCAVRVVPDSSEPTAAPTYGLGDMLARDQIRENLQVGRLTPFASSPVHGRRRAAPAPDLADMLAREELVPLIQMMGY